MAFLTDRKRVQGHGASGSGTEDHWRTTVSAVGLLILVPLFLITFVPYIGAGHDAVTAHFARPWPAIVSGLTLVVALAHMKNGMRVLIEDYVHGGMRELLIIATALMTYAIMAIGLYALVRLAL